MTSNRIRTLTGHRIPLEFAQNIPNLQAFFEIIILVGVDKLEIFAAVEDNRMVLVVRLSVTKNRIPGQFNAKPGFALASILVELGIAVNESKKESGFTTFLPGRFFIQVRNVKVRIGAKQELRVLQLLLLEQSTVTWR